MNPASQPMLEQLTALGRDEERLAMDGVGDVDKAVLTAVLDRIIANLENRLGCKAAICADMPETVEG